MRQHLILVLYFIMHSKGSNEGTKDFFNMYNNEGELKIVILWEILFRLHDNWISF